MDEYFEEFRMNMKYYREQRGFSQADLAIQANSSNGMIGNIEAGKARPSFQSIVNIAKALGIHPADLFLRNSSQSSKHTKEVLNSELLSLVKDFINRTF